MRCPVVDEETMLIGARAANKARKNARRSSVASTAPPPVSAPPVAPTRDAVPARDTVVAVPAAARRPDIEAGVTTGKRA